MEKASKNIIASGNGHIYIPHCDSLFEIEIGKSVFETKVDPNVISCGFNSVYNRFFILSDQKIVIYIIEKENYVYNMDEKQFNGKTIKSICFSPAISDVLILLSYNCTVYMFDTSNCSIVNASETEYIRVTINNSVKNSISSVVFDIQVKIWG